MSQPESVSSPRVGRHAAWFTAAYGPNAGVRLATQRYPDAVHHADWPGVRLDPGQVATHVMVHRFTR